jgi:hypothetical protein
MMVSVQNEAWEKENALRLKWHRRGKENRRLEYAAADGVKRKSEGSVVTDARVKALGLEQ